MHGGDAIAYRIACTKADSLGLVDMRDRAAASGIGNDAMIIIVIRTAEAEMEYSGAVCAGQRIVAEFSMVAGQDGERHEMNGH